MPRQPSAFAFTFPRLRPGVRALIIAVGAVSIGLGALAAWISASLGGRLIGWTELQPATIWRGHVWKLFTYGFLILDPISLLFTGLWLWWLGSEVEEQWGRRRMLLHYFGSTALGGLLAALLGLAVPVVGVAVYAGGLGTTVMPALVGYALAVPGRDVNLLLVPPFKARLLIPIATGIMLLQALMTGSVVPLVVPFFTQLAAIALVRLDLPRPSKLWLRVRVWWFERRMRGRKLHVVPGLPDDDELPKPRSGGRGSDQYLH